MSLDGFSCQTWHSSCWSYSRNTWTRDGCMDLWTFALENNWENVIILFVWLNHVPHFIIENAVTQIVSEIRTFESDMCSDWTINSFYLFFRKSLPDVSKIYLFNWNCNSYTNLPLNIFWCAKKSLAFCFYIWQGNKQLRYSVGKGKKYFQRDDDDNGGYEMVCYDSTIQQQKIMFSILFEVEQIPLCDTLEEKNENKSSCSLNWFLNDFSIGIRRQQTKKIIYFRFSWVCGWNFCKFKDSVFWSCLIYSLQCSSEKSMKTNLLRKMPDKKYHRDQIRHVHITDRCKIMTLFPVDVSWNFYTRRKSNMFDHFFLLRTVVRGESARRPPFGPTIWFTIVVCLFDIQPNVPVLLVNVV